MSIQKYNPQQNLEVVEQIKVALTSSMVKDTPKKGLFDYVTNSITRLYAAARFTAPSPEEMNVIVTETFKVIVENYPTLRYQEMDIAFRKGLIGEYGEYKGLSVPTFNNWIKAYMVDRTRLEQLPTKLQIEAPKEPTDIEKFKLATDNVLKAFEAYSAGKDISTIASTVYKTLFKLKLVNYTEEEVHEFETQAAMEVRADLNAQKASATDNLIRKAIVNKLDGEDFELKVILQARRLGCYAYFQELILNKVDLKEVIEFKRVEIFGEGRNDI